MDFKELIKAGNHAPSIVISGFKEPVENTRLLNRGLDLEGKICDILEILKVNAGLSEIFPMGTSNPAGPRGCAIGPIQPLCNVVYFHPFDVFK
ncbi:hypothetical protein ANCDUO_10719 [Ancylostoma duodenale]|uniref:Uncharacterized protein n=1 Tax=Ancylostoma duodenale TaxID=51022 RepID=A0A0C2GJK8_9BILA|nr:hypothetical protein ANCDUO_10719 [Ancylostoma duodenale]